MFFNTKFQASVLIAATCFSTIGTPGMARDLENSTTSELEHAAILSVLHSTGPVKRLSREWKNQEIVLNSERTKIDGPWAWVEASPATKDGKRNFDPISGVMHKRNGTWKMSAWLPDEVVSADDSKAAFQKWTKKFCKQHQDCTPSIFPAE